MTSALSGSMPQLTNISASAKKKEIYLSEWQHRYFRSECCNASRAATSAFGLLCSRSYHSCTQLCRSSTTVSDSYCRYGTRLSLLRPCDRESAGDRESICMGGWSFSFRYINMQQAVVYLFNSILYRISLLSDLGLHFHQLQMHQQSPDRHPFLS